MLHLGNSAEVSKEKIKDLHRRVEQDHLVQQALAGKEHQKLLQSLGGRLLGLLDKKEATGDGNKQVGWANESA